MNKRIYGIVLSAAILFSSPITFAQAAVMDENATAVSFSDISGHWSEDAVEELLKKNAIPFKGESFMPEESIKRSEFAVILHDALGVQICYFAKPEIRDYFNDIDENAPYASDVIDLATVGIFEDTDNFKPDETLTREELVHYIMNAYKYRMGDNYALIKIRPADFSDIDMVTLEYSVDVALAEHYGLVYGTGNNAFQPKKAATRAEAAAVTSRLIALLDNVNAQVTVEPKAVKKDDSIEMSLSIKNNTDNDVYMYNTSGQMFDYEILDSEYNSLYRWSADKAFIQIVSDTKIEAGKSLDFSDTLSGDTFNAIKDKAAYMRVYITGSADFINPDGYLIAL